MPPRAAAVAAMLCAFSATPAVAADIDWQIVSGLSTDYLERQVQRMAANGYRVQAIVGLAVSATIACTR